MSPFKGYRYLFSQIPKSSSLEAISGFKLNSLAGISICLTQSKYNFTKELSLVTTIVCHLPISTTELVYI
ncbi:MAG: hypothetical protein LBF15_04590 [Candidatus Peribacteria bacterium]|jgi:hypothetical protein|nr:hypothetical protein [Candidatus Peribacteria bacterium]